MNDRKKCDNERESQDFDERVKEARGNWLEENAQGFAERDFFRALFDLSQEPE